MKHERLCIFCFHPFQAKSKKARYCCSGHRVKYFRRRKNQEKQKMRRVHHDRLVKRDLESKLVRLQLIQEDTNRAINEVKRQMASLICE